MKRNISFHPIFFAVFTLWACLILSSCVKSSTQPSTSDSTTTVYTLIKSASNLTVIDSAIDKIGAQSQFANSPITCFVTTDAEYATVGLTDSVVNVLPDTTLEKFFLYTAIPQNLLASNLPAGPDASMQTLSGDSIFVTNNGVTVYVNGIQLTAANIEGYNGEIDALVSPLLPPAGTILQIAQTDTSFSFFAAAVNRTNSAQTNVYGLLSSGNIYTVFMATNSAFQALGYQSITDINNADPDSLSKILQYNIIPRRLFTSDFGNNQTTQTLYSQETVSFGTIGLSIYGVQGKGNTSVIGIVSPNVMARNGVIHVTTQLLLP